MNLSKKQQIELFNTLLTIRRFEERLYQEFYAGTITGFVHSYIGEEAIAAGVISHLTKTDRIVSHHRGHGHCIAKGADMKRMMAEIHGKITGYCKGKGGSMHIADFSIGMLGADGIVGAGMPIATGAAIAAQLEKRGKIAAVFFGDGACQEGEFHEALNLASLWKLPLLFVCENNGWGVNTSVRESFGARKITRVPNAFHIAHNTVDGNDVEQVYRATGEAVARLRKGNGPFFLECKTYRWHKHFLSDALPDMRPREEIEAWKKKCPVRAYEKKLLKRKVLSPSKIKSMDDKILTKIEEAHTFALASPFPKPQDAMQDIFSK